MTNAANKKIQFFNPNIIGTTHDIFNDPDVQQHWLNDKFELDDLTPDKVNEAMDRFVYYSNKRRQEQQEKQKLLTIEEDFEYATSLEVICASIALERYPLHGKPKSPNGYHGYDGGPRKAGT